MIKFYIILKNWFYSKINFTIISPFSDYTIFIRNFWWKLFFFFFKTSVEVWDILYVHVHVRVCVRACACACVDIYNTSLYIYSSRIYFSHFNYKSHVKQNLYQINIFMTQYYFKCKRNRLDPEIFNFKYSLCNIICN